MKKALLVVLLGLIGLGLLGSLGCTRVQSATQVGGTEPATWVFIDTNSPSRSGVFRCALVEGAARPLCVRAEMRY